MVCSARVLFGGSARRGTDRALPAGAADDRRTLSYSVGRLELWARSRRDWVDVGSSGLQGVCVARSPCLVPAVLGRAGPVARPRRRYGARCLSSVTSSRAAAVAPARRVVGIARRRRALLRIRSHHACGLLECVGAGSPGRTGCRVHSRGTAFERRARDLSGCRFGPGAVTQCAALLVFSRSMAALISRHAARAPSNPAVDEVLSGSSIL